MRTYADYKDFESFGMTPAMEESEAVECLRTASICVDDICFGRIERYLEKLPEKTLEMVKEAVLIQSNFYHNNRELFDMNLKSYSVAGVNMTLEIPRGAQQINNTIVDSRAVALLRGCGLMSCNFGWYRGLM